MEAPKISQKEYLKRYLSKDDGKKKKKKKLKVGVRTVKIIDQEIDLKNITTIMEDDDINILNQSEDAPQIVGIIDERNPADFSNKQKWKVIADDGTGDIAISKIEDQYRDERKKNINKRDQRLGENLSSSKKKSSKKKESRNQKNESDSDMSPPRSKTGKNRDESDSDLSPPRHKKHRNEADSDSDLSPPRNKSNNSSNRNHSASQDRYSTKSDYSSSSRRENSRRGTSSSKTGKNRDESDSDLSPPRHKKHRNEADSDSDLSPPRNKSNNSSKRNHSASQDRYSTKSDYSSSSRRENSRRGTSSSKTGKNRDESDSDLSPPRHKKHRNEADSDSDLSPPRNKSNNSSKRNHSASQDRYSSKSDYSSSSRRENSRRGTSSSKTGKNRDESDSDLSPPRHKKNRRGTSSRWNEKRKRSSSPKEKQGISKTKKTLAGTNAGLRSLESLRQELEEQKRIENEKMKKINKEMRGYEQSAVQRDRKTGRRRDFEKEAADQMEKNKEQEEINAKYAVWGRGLKQMGERGDQMKRDLHEMNKPLARYADDKDLEDELKDRERDDDPMLAYIKEKRIREGKAEPEKPQFRGSYMPNRFNIRPGYRWDGVDRSNGYEKKWMDAQSANKAVEEEAYRYSTADM